MKILMILKIIILFLGIRYHRLRKILVKRVSERVKKLQWILSISITEFFLINNAFKATKNYFHHQINIYKISIYLYNYLWLVVTICLNCCTCKLWWSILVVVRIDCGDQKVTRWGHQPHLKQSSTSKCACFCLLCSSRSLASSWKSSPSVQVQCL